MLLSLRAASSRLLKRNPSLFLNNAKIPVESDALTRTAQVRSFLALGQGDWAKRRPEGEGDARFTLLKREREYSVKEQGRERDVRRQIPPLLLSLLQRFHLF